MDGNNPVANFLDENFPGRNFIGGSLMGGNFPGGNFPGKSFPRTLKNAFSIICCSYYFKEKLWLTAENIKYL